MCMAAGVVTMFGSTYNGGFEDVAGADAKIGECCRPPLNTLQQ